MAEHCDELDEAEDKEQRAEEDRGGVHKDREGVREDNKGVGGDPLLQASGVEEGDLGAQGPPRQVSVDVLPQQGGMMEFRISSSFPVSRCYKDISPRIQYVLFMILVFGG